MNFKKQENNNMNLSIYNKVEQFVFDSFDKEIDRQHLIQTVYWLKELCPEADEVLLVAAIAHDIERAYRKKDLLEKKVSVGFANIEFYRLHEERGAEIIANFLKQEKVDNAFIKRVRFLISRHEEGGNDDQNFLKDADSISFFEIYVPLFLEKVIFVIGKEKTKEKFDWMFNRISSEKAKEIVQPIYEKAISDLNMNFEKL